MTEAEAERYLLSLELFGMRFGLDRMRRLMTALGHPERQFDSIHVVGTNGKSSTTRMIAAILAHHGLRIGAYLSPHLVRFGERIRIDNQDLGPAEFGAAVARAAHAAELVDRSLDPDDRVTQFEALTAAAYSELAARRVQVAVIEAGLGGRYDATNVIPSRVQVLTSVGLEHTRWLGPTLTDIAGEKLDVVQPGATLVLGTDLDPDVIAVAERVCGERNARIVQAGADPGVAVGASGTFQRRNFALARAAAEAYLGRLDAAAVTAAAREVRVPGRLQQIDDHPLTLIDGAHNPDGMRALAESLPELVTGHGQRRGCRLDPGRQRCGRNAVRAGVRRSRDQCADPHEQSESTGLASTDAPIIGSPVVRSSGGDRGRPAAGAGPGARAGRARRRRHRRRIAVPDRGSVVDRARPARLDPVTAGRSVATRFSRRRQP